MADDHGRFEDTIDWNAYWREGNDDDAYPASVAANKVALLRRFFEEAGLPEDAAFVGCGRAELPSDIAKSYPELEVVCYDAAESVIRANRDEYAGVPNVTFDVATLPDLEIGRRFEFVWTYATLHYVREIENAIESLYELVRPGGHLVCSYPNSRTQETHQDLEGELRERFALVSAGANTISRSDIEALLGVPTTDFWSVTDADGPYVRPANPCVVIGK